jgi:hypothetical protein
MKKIHVGLIAGALLLTPRIPFAQGLWWGSEKKFEATSWGFRDNFHWPESGTPESGMILIQYTDKEYKSYLLKTGVLAKHGYKVSYESRMLRFRTVDTANVAFEAYSQADMAGLSRFLGGLWKKYPDIIEQVSPPAEPLKLESLGLTGKGHRIWINKRWSIEQWHDVMKKDKFEFLHDYTFDYQTNSFEYRPLDPAQKGRAAKGRTLSAQENEALVNRILKTAPEDFAFHTQEDEDRANNARHGAYGSGSATRAVPQEEGAAKNAALNKMKKLDVRPPDFHDPSKN